MTSFSSANESSLTGGNFADGCGRKEQEEGKKKDFQRKEGRTQREREKKTKKMSIRAERKKKH